MSRIRAVGRSALAIGVSLGLVTGALPAAATSVDNGPRAGAVAAPSMEKPRTGFAGPELTHKIYVVGMHGPAGYPPFSVPDLEDAARKAGAYWVEELRGAIASFELAGVQYVLSGQPCAAINDVDQVPTQEWDAAAAKFPQVDFESGQNHLVVVAPPNCAREGSSVATQGQGIGSSGRALVGGVDVQTMTQALGSNISLGKTVHGFVRDGVLEERWYLGMFGPQSYSFDEAPPGALDVGLQDALGALPAQQVEHVGATKTVSLTPMTQQNGVRGATFLDPVSGERVWVEYRDGKGRDAANQYATGSALVNLDETILYPGVSNCEKTHGKGAVECSTTHVFAPGVRVYHVGADNDVTNIGLPRGFASKATLSPGDVLTGPGGGYTVAVTSLSAAAATVQIAVQHEPEAPEHPAAPEEPGDPAEPETPEPAAASIEVAGATTDYGTPAELAVAVDSSAPALGEIGVWEGAKKLASAQLVDGAVKVSLPAKLAVGTHALTVRYGGSNAVAAAEVSATVTVRKALPKVEITAPTAVRGKRTKITITAGAGLPANGKVAVYVDGKKRKTLSLSAGKATYRLPKKISVGKHKVQVRHLGNSRYARSTFTTTLRVWRSVAQVKGFTARVKKVAARGLYRDTVRLSSPGVLQRKTAKGWRKVKKLARGKQTIRVRAGKSGSVRKYRVVIKNHSHVKGVRTKVLTLRAR